MNKTFSFFVQRYFSAYLIGQHNYGTNTIESYRDTFRLLLTYIENNCKKKKNLMLQDIPNQLIIDFLNWLISDRGNSSSTRNVRLAHLKSFFHFVKMEEPSLYNHCEQIINIPFTKVEKKPPEYMDEDSVSHMLHSVNSESKEGLRHLAILSLMYDSGCRVQELIDLKVSDIQFEKGQRIYVHGKGNKYRAIPITPETESILKKYISVFGINSDNLLFTNKQGQALTRQGVGYILKKYAVKSKDENPSDFYGNVHPHILRHSKATHLVNAGVNIYNVRDFLGHSSIATTQVYLTSNPEVTRKAIEKVASQTVSDSTNYYSEEEKQSLMEFLNNLT